MKNKIVIIAAAVILLALLGGAGYYIWRQQQTIDELTEGFALEKEQLEDEYTQLAIQYEGYKLQVNNDSLEQKLEDQRIKIQRLVEELRQTKAQDARRIAALNTMLPKSIRSTRSTMPSLPKTSRYAPTCATCNSRTSKFASRTRHSPRR